MIYRPARLRRASGQRRGVRALPERRTRRRRTRSAALGPVVQSRRFEAV